MITHTIYHIPGRKVGCTRNLAMRLRWYERYEGAKPKVEVLEELHDCTDQEAGDREWYWSDHYGYFRGVHYIHSWNKLTAEQKTEIGQKGGKASIASQIAKGVHASQNPGHMKKMNEAAVASGKTGFQTGVTGRASAKSPNHMSKNPEHVRKWRKAGTDSPNHISKNPEKNPFFQIYTCPHCDREGKGAVMFRHHFDNCKMRGD